MKYLYLITLSLLCLIGRAQTTDTIFANDHQNVAIFFPDKIRQAVVGAENFVFSYSQEHPGYFGLLKGSSGNHSNLLAITEDGQIYSYILAYQKKLPQLLHFLQKEASTGNEIYCKVSRKDSVHRLPGRAKDSSKKILFIQNLAEKFYSSMESALKRKERNGIKFQLNELVHNNEEVYVILEVANSSNIDFRTRYVHLYLSQGNKKRNSSYQRILQEPLLTYKFPDIIKQGNRERFVLVFPKFTIGENQMLEIELREKKGHRAVKLELDI